MLDTSRFQDVDKYAAYLKTPAGQLCSELAWENVRRFLPGNASECGALDVDGGTGRYGICAFEPVWKSSPNVMFACFVTTWRLRV